MKKVLKWFFGTVIIVLICVLVFAGVMYARGGAKVNKVYPATFDPVEITQDSVRVAHGQYLAATHGCQSCHGPDLSGQIMADAPPFLLAASNLTSGEGGIGSLYADEDWLRSIRHGVAPDGRGLWVMPSEAYYFFSDEEIASLVSYLKQLPPVDNVVPKTTLKPLGKIIAGLDDAMSPTPEIMLDMPRMEMPEPGPTVEYGKYRVTTFCGVCHGMDIRGKQPPDPNSPFAPDLRVAAGWGLEAFTRSMRTGVVPGGRQLNPEFMPWEDAGRMTDQDLEAIFRYIESEVE